MITSFKIGLTPSTLTDFVRLPNRAGAIIENAIKRDITSSLHGGRYVKITGFKKKDASMDFDVLTHSELSDLQQYIDTGLYYIELIDDSTTIIAGYYYLIADQNALQSINNGIRTSLKVDLIQV